jgi:hypothetical protein
MATRASGFMTLLLLVSLGALAACDNKDNAAKKEQSSTAASTAATAAADKQDPCGLLNPEDVAAVIGPLAGPPYRSNGGVTPSPNGKSCRYETADLHALSVEVMWQGGAQFMGMMGAVQGVVKSGGLKELKLIDGTTVAGEWDEARVSQCCVFNALRGDQMVIVDISGSRATLAQASSLADAAVKRLDQPLKIDGSAGIKPARERIALRPKARSVCDLVTKADAEAIAGVALLAAPKGNEDSCSYELAARYRRELCDQADGAMARRVRRDARGPWHGEQCDSHDQRKQDVRPGRRAGVQPGCRNGCRQGSMGRVLSIDHRRLRGEERRHGQY